MAIYRSICFSIDLHDRLPNLASDFPYMTMFIQSDRPNLKVWNRSQLVLPVSGFYSNYQGFSNLEDVKHKIAGIIKQLSEDIIHSLTGWEHILNALSL